MKMAVSYKISRMIEYFSATKFLLLKTVKRWQKSRN